jgi:hypothetical protein
MYGDFYSDLKTGKIAERIIEDWLKKQELKNKISSYKRTEHTEYEGLGYENDFQYVQNGQTKYLEAKYLSGTYENGNECPTFCVEKWADNPRTKRPGWYRTAEHCKDNNLEAMIVFYNNFDKTLYFHNSVILRKFVEHNPYETWSKVANRDEKGWIVTYSWDFSLSFIGKINNVYDPGCED